MQKLKGRFVEVIDFIEKHSKGLPSLKDYRAVARPKPFGTSAAAPAAAARTVDADDFLAGTETIATRLAPPPVMWNTRSIKAALGALQQYGKPSGRTLLLPPEYFTAQPSADAAAAAPAPKPIDLSDSSSATADAASASAPAADQAATPAPAAASAAAIAPHEIVDSWPTFCSFDGFRKDLSQSDIRHLVDAILKKAHALEKMPKADKKEKKEESKEDKADKKKADKKKEASLEELLDIDLTRIIAHRVLVRVALMDDITAVLQQGATLRQQLQTAAKNPVPYPSYGGVDDDVELLVGVAKHGLKWTKIREDPALNVLKSLPLETAAPKGKAAAAAAAATAASTAAAPVVEDENSRDSTEQKDVIMEDGDKPAAAAAAAAASGDAPAAGAAAKKKSAPTFPDQKLLERLRALVSHLQRQQRNSTVSVSVRSSISDLSGSGSKQHHSTPVKTPSKQPTLGSRFGVEDGIAVEAGPKHTHASPRKLSGLMNASATSGVGKPATPKKAVTPKKQAKPVMSSLYDKGEIGEDIDDFISPPPAKKQRAEPTPTAAAAPASAPKPAPKPALQPLFDDIEDVDDFDVSPPPDKRQKTENGAVAKPAPAAAAAAASTPASKAKPAVKPVASASKLSTPAAKPKAASSASTGKNASSSNKKNSAAKNQPPVGMSTLSNFFKPKPITAPTPVRPQSIAALGMPASSPARITAPTATTAPARSPQKRVRDEDVIDID